MSDKLTPIMRKKIESATQIINDYSGENIYFKFLKYLSENKGIKVDKHSQKLVHRYKDIKPKTINKWVKTHPFFNVYYNRIIDGKQMIPYDGHIYIEQILKVSANNIEFWGKIYQNQNSSFRYEIPKNYFIDKIVEDVDVNLDIDFKSRKPLNHQKPAVEFLLKRKQAILGDDMGLGKLIADDQPVLTPNGWVNHGSLKVGDYVIGKNGKPTKVLAVYPNPMKDYYNITFTDGTTVEACDEHLWAVQTPTHKHRDNNYKILTIKDMLDKNGTITFNGVSGNNKNKKYNTSTYYKMKNGDCKWYIPMVEPVHFEPQVVKINPYLLGVLLGDGHFGEKVISFTTIDQQIINEISKNLPENISLSDYKHEQQFGFKMVDRKGENNLKNYLNEYNLIGCNSSTKFIPKEYLYNSINIRLELLQGLLDTDGYCAKDGTIQYYSVSKKLSNDVKEIVQSLGGVARESSKIGKYKLPDGTIKECKECFILTINLPEGITPFKLERKIKNMKVSRKYLPSRGIKNIEFSRKTSGQCISVEADDSLYVIKDYVVTHNTFSSIYAAMAGGFEKILVVCPASLKYNWKREIGFLDDPDNVSILNSNRFEQSKWTIVNYDILKNFHRLPLNEKGNMCDRSDFIPSPFESAEYDLIIVDEAHYLKSNKSQRSKLFKDFAQFSEYIWLLTGTPIPNKVENIFNLLSLINSPLSNNQDYFLLRYCGGYKSRIGNRQIIKTRGASNLPELREMLEFDMLRRTKHSAGVDLPDKLIRAIYLSLDGEYKYRQLLSEYEDWVAENEDTQITLSDHLQQLVKIRMMLSEAKIAATIETIEGFIEQEKKVVVFSCFSNTIRQIHDHFGKKSVLVDGKVKGDKRQKAVDMFQNNKKVHVFCGNIIAAGVGLTLTKGTVVIFNDLDWVPANHMQAEDRCYRIGQNEDVNILYMLFEESLDELMYESLNKKRGNIDIATGDVNEVQFSVAQEVIKNISDITT